MGVGACQTGNVAVIFLLRSGIVSFDQLFQSLISGAVVAVDGDQLPVIAVDGICVRVDGQIKPSDLVRTCDSLDDGNTVHNAGFLQIGMGVSADDDVHAPSGIQQGSQLLILLKADMGQQHRQIHILCPVSVADPAHLGSGLVDIDEGTDQPFLPGLGQHLLGEDANEQHLHAAHFQNDVTLEKAHLIGGQVEVCVDDGKPGAFFQKQHMPHTVINLMVTQGRHIGSQHIHDLDGGKTHELAVDDGAPEHITGDGIEDIFFLCPDLLDIAGKHGNTAGELAALILGKKISVHIIGVEEGQFFQIFHNSSCFSGHSVGTMPSSSPIISPREPNCSISSVSSPRSPELPIWPNSLIASSR